MYRKEEDAYIKEFINSETVELTIWVEIEITTKPGDFVSSSAL